MEVRSLSKFDDISHITKQHPFGLAENYLLQKVASRGKDIIAVGQLLPMIEVLIMEDLERPKPDKIFALRELMNEAMFEAERLRYKQLHAFVRDRDFAEILKRHWNFKPCTGEALVLNLKENHG